MSDVIDVTGNNSPRLTYQKFQTEDAGVIELVNEHWYRLASRLTEFEMILALRAIPRIRLSEAKRIAEFYKSVTK